MSDVNVSLRHLLSKMLWKAEEPSHELHGPQHITDMSFVSESCSPKWYILRLRLGFKEVWSNITKFLIDVGCFCSTQLPLSPAKKQTQWIKKPPPNPENKLNVLTKKSPKILKWTDISRVLKICHVVSMLYVRTIDLLHCINFRLRGKLVCFFLFYVSYKVTLFYRVYIW